MSHLRKSFSAVAVAIALVVGLAVMTVLVLALMVLSAQLGGLFMGTDTPVPTRTPIVIKVPVVKASPTATSTLAYLKPEDLATVTAISPTATAVTVKATSTPLAEQGGVLLVTATPTPTATPTQLVARAFQVGNTPLTGWLENSAFPILIWLGHGAVFDCEIEKIDSSNGNHAKYEVGAWVPRGWAGIYSAEACGIKLDGEGYRLGAKAYYQIP